MIKIYFHTIYLLALFILVSSCSKENITDDKTTVTTDLTLLKSNQWKVIAKENILKLEGALGGGRGTIAFTTQKPDELRWYTKHFTMANFSDHHEMIINRQDQVTINKDFKAPSYGGDIKGFVGTDVWKVNMAEVANWVYVFKNDQMVDLSENPEGRTKIVRIQASEDGMLNSSETLTLNYASHYHYATQKWKNNKFVGNNFVTLRHQSKTYVIAFTRLTSANGMSIFVESDNRVVVQDPQIPSIQTVHYPMTTLKYVPGEYGFLTHASQYGDNVFVVFHSHTSNTRFGVVKVNLTNLTGQLVQAPEQIVSNNTAVEVDDAGNLYVVENRVENMNGNYSIRKYAANGGNEVILKEQDLHSNTQIHGIKWFNGKLYVALVNREDIPDGNPNDNSFQVMYHMQVISPK
jgi:hypothetical protein